MYKSTSVWRSLSVLLLVTSFMLVSYHFIKAAVSQPVNIGSATQQKAGSLGADIVFAIDEMRSPEYCDSLGNNCAAVPPGAMAAITYTTNQNPQNYPERTACSCAAGDMLTGCSGFQRGDNNTGPLSNGRAGCYSDGETTAQCHCLRTNAAQTSTGQSAYWYTGSYGVCVAPNQACGWSNAGTQTRTVECQDMITGASLASTSCTGLKPTASRSCSKYFGSCR